MERRNLALLCAGVLCFWLFALAVGTAQGAGLRVQNPEMSLQQLAERSDPPVSKSCMNHRMRRLMEEARESHE